MLKDDVDTFIKSFQLKTILHVSKCMYVSSNLGSALGPCHVCLPIMTK